MIWGMELASAAAKVAHAEGAGSDGGGQDALGLAGFGVGLCWAGNMERVSLHQVGEEKEEIYGSQCDSCWLDHIGVWSVFVWTGWRRCNNYHCWVWECDRG